MQIGEEEGVETTQEQTRVTKNQFNRSRKGFKKTQRQNKDLFMFYLLVSFVLALK